MRATIHRDERGLTLTELLAVMAILGVLASLVFGAVAALGGKSQTARLEGDRETIGKAANQFFTEAFPETFPVVDLDDTDADIVVTPDLDVRLVDFKAKLPQDPNTDFVPDFLTDIPDSTALVSWRIDTDSGNAFFAADGSPLIRPSTNTLDIDAVTNTPGVVSDHEFVLTMAKNEAALETLEIRVPASYSVGGQSGRGKHPYGLPDRDPGHRQRGGLGPDHPLRWSDSHHSHGQRVGPGCQLQRQYLHIG